MVTVTVTTYLPQEATSGEVRGVQGLHAAQTDVTDIAYFAIFVFETKARPPIVEKPRRLHL